MIYRYTLIIPIHNPSYTGTKDTRDMRSDPIRSEDDLFHNIMREIL